MERERQDFKKSRVNISSSLTAESKDQVLLQLKVTNAHMEWLPPRNIVTVAEQILVCGWASTGGVWYRYSVRIVQNKNGEEKKRAEK